MDGRHCFNRDSPDEAELAEGSPAAEKLGAGSAVVGKSEEEAENRRKAGKAVFSLIFKQTISSAKTRNQVFKCLQASL